MALPIDAWQADGYVHALTVSSDGARVGAAVRNYVMIWDLHTRQVMLGPLKGHTNPLRSVAFSPNGRTLASGSRDYTIRIWDTETGNTTLRPLTGHASSVYSVIFSPDGHFLISGSDDKTIRLWDTLTGQPICNPIQTGSTVNSVAISPDGARIFGALDNKTIRAYDISTGTQLLTFAGHENTVYSIAVSPDGRRIASGSGDSTVRIWDTATGHTICDPLKGHTTSVRSIAYSFDGRYIASGSNDNTIQIWNAEAGAPQDDQLRGHTKWVHAVVFTPDSTSLISGSSDQTIRVWDVHGLGIQPPAHKTLPRQRTQLAPVEDEITGTTTLVEIIALLGARGCVNLTDQLDPATCNNHPISSGGFGDIYRSKMNSGIEVAIKTMRVYVGSSEQDQNHLKHAAREIYAWSKCRHPNVQPLLGLVVFRGQLGMIAVWESNGSLPQYLKHHTSTDRCVLSTQIAGGLKYLHASGVVHGDLKGANVLISQRGIPQLADFGNAQLKEYTLKFSKTSSKGAITPRWAAPELFKDEKRNFETDVYALGMTILETITGDVPFPEKNDYTTMYSVTVEKARPTRPEAFIPVGSKHGETLWSLLNACWEYVLNERPSAEEVMTVMNGITQGGLTRG